MYFKIKKNNVGLTLFLIIALSFCNLSIQAKGKVDKWNSLIYKPGKIFIFQADYDSAGVKYRSYIAMSISNEEKVNQRIIAYQYFDSLPRPQDIDSIVTFENRHIESTLIVDKGNYIWIHPPRWYFSPPRLDGVSPLSHSLDGLTQYFPFPEISLPTKIGKKYAKRSFYINDPICDCNLWMKYSEKNKGYTECFYQEMPIDAILINGISESKIGKYEYNYFFNEEYGFVKWQYNCDNTIFLELNLVDIINM